ncbi:potassium channel family protein (plasmid) [Mesorhizobium sp. B2-1-1]|nr:potassium channel family protein [Mesorhizobium sp. B2-1-1]
MKLHCTFSTITFSTVGYGDIVPALAWRVLAALECVNGFLLIGWSTACLIAAGTASDRPRRASISDQLVLRFAPDQYCTGILLVRSYDRVSHDLADDQQEGEICLSASLDELTMT